METQKGNIFSKRKGQSAIEYLMTYGWMLLVVAIVGGAIFATVQGQCAQQASGFTGETVTVSTFEVTPDNVQVELTNGGSEQVNITRASLLDDNGYVNNATVSQAELNVGDSTVAEFGGVSQSDACNNYDLEIEFNRGDITGAVSTGTISGNMAP